MSRRAMRAELAGPLRQELPRGPTRWRDSTAMSRAYTAWIHAYMRLAISMASKFKSATARDE